MRPDDHAGEQVNDLVPGQRDLVCRVGVAGVPEGGCDGEDGIGKHGEGGPPVPGGPAAGLMLVQAGHALPVWNFASMVQRSPVTLDQGGQDGRLRAEAAVKGQLAGALVPADRQVPGARSLMATQAHGSSRIVIVNESLTVESTNGIQVPPVWERPCKV